MAEIIVGIGNKKVFINLPSEVEKRGFNIVKKEILDSSKLQLLGWQAHCDMRQGLEHTIKQFKRYYSQY